MRKKVLSAALSIMMCAASFTPAFGAEFSSGEAEGTVAEGQYGFDQESVFSSGIEDGVSEEVLFGEPETEEFEALSNEENEHVFQEDDEEIVYQAGLINSAPTCGDAEEIVTNKEYTGAVTEEWESHWYKFVPKEDGKYKLEIKITDYDTNIEDVFGEYIIYTGDISNLDDYYNGYTYEEDCEIFLDAGETYYISVAIYSDNYEYGYMSGRCSLKMSEGYINTAPSYTQAEKIVLNQECGGSVTKNAADHWYKFVPEKTGSYSCSCLVEDCDDSYDNAAIEYAIYSEKDLKNQINPWTTRLKSGAIYYIKVSINTKTEKIAGSYKVKIERKMFDIDYINDILEEKGSLPLLNEKEGAAEETNFVFNGGTNKSFMQFIPKYDGMYDIYLKEKGKSDNKTWYGLQVYKEKMVTEIQLEPAEQDYNSGRYILEKGKKYFIVYEKNYSNPDTLVCVTKHFDRPEVVSLKLVSGPTRTELYLGVPDFLFAGGVGLPGLKAEVTYDDGTKEIISNDAVDKTTFAPAETKYGYYMQTKLDGVDWTKGSPTVGNYTATVSIGGKSVKIKNITVKNINELPLLTGVGSMQVVSSVYGSAWIKFKPTKTGTYQLSNSVKRDMMVYDNSNKGTVDQYGYPGKELEFEKNTNKITLKAGNYYYIGVERIGRPASSVKREDKVTITVGLEKISLSKCKITAASSAIYTGKAVMPTVKLMYGTTTLKKDTDYAVSYSNNTNLGTATITITGKGNYTGAVKKTFTIKLGAPTVKAAASAGYNAVKVTWNKVPGANTYTLYYKGGSVKSWKLIKSGIKETKYMHVSSKNRPLTTGTAYTYTVKAVSGKNVSVYGTSTKEAKPLPAVPKLGKVTSTAYNKQKITWSKVAGATGYIVYQKINGKWVKIGTTKATSYTNTHSGKHPVLTGVTNTYTVKAYRTVGKTNIAGSCSKTGISGKALLTKPAISKVTKTSKGLKLQWKKVSGATGYIVQRYESGKWVTKKTITSSKTLTYTDTTAKKGKTYKYRIAAYRTVNKKKVLSTYSAAKSGMR